MSTFTDHAARRPARARQHRLRHRRHRAVAACSAARSTSRCRSASSLPLAEAVEAVGRRRRSDVTGVVIPLVGDMDAVVLLAVPGRRRRHAVPACSASSPAPRTAISALGEIGNILGASYIGSLGAMTGLELEPHAAADGRPTCSARSSRPCSPSRADGHRHGADPRLRAARRGRAVLAVLPAAARAAAACARSSRAWAWRHDRSVRDRGAHGRARRVVEPRRRARVHRPGLVHRARARRPAPRHRRAGARDAARGARGRRAPVGKFADLAVPELVDAGHRARGVPPALQAVLVGGAQMFSLGSVGAPSTSAPATRPLCAPRWPRSASRSSRPRSAARRAARFASSRAAQCSAKRPEVPKRSL